MALHFPDYAKDEQASLQLDEAFEDATVADRMAAIPVFAKWIDDENPKVRGRVLLCLGMLNMPGKTPQAGTFATIPVRYIPAVAAHLNDPIPFVRNVAYLAAMSIATSAAMPVASSGAGFQELVKLVIPMLREPDAVLESPDPFFVEATKGASAARERVLATLTPEQRAAVKTPEVRIAKLPAEGTRWIGILAYATRSGSAGAEDAIIAFLDRKDQTKSTLEESLHTLAVTHASERVNIEALRRVFEEKAMTTYLLQFLGWMQLSPAEIGVQKERLVALSQDESASPGLRHSAKKVAACWGEPSTGKMCGPDAEDLREQVDGK